MPALPALSWCRLPVRLLAYAALLFAIGCGGVLVRLRARPALGRPAEGVHQPPLPTNVRGSDGTPI
ncbi:hypothetical protein AB5I41_15580 [Sphingomonas sp. MMS24-JH45]